MKLPKEIEEAIEFFILKNIDEHPNDLIKFVMKYFEISRPTVTKIVNQMLQKKLIEKDESRKKPNYRLKESKIFKRYKLNSLEKNHLEEHVIFEESIKPLLSELGKNVVDLIDYASCEILNNAIDHSQGTDLYVLAKTNYKTTAIIIADNGIGIFNKICNDLNLSYPNQAILELHKGKFTSDKETHSGEGIFFASKMMDYFSIESDKIMFEADSNSENTYTYDNSLLSENDVHFTDLPGTIVYFNIDNFSKRTINEIFDKYATNEETPGFITTSIPVKILTFENGNLNSRSQAKRLMSRVENFRNVILDFKGVDLIGQAFADEVFRVYQNKFPKLNITTKNTTPIIDKIIKHVKG
ncbi:MAG: DUF4325 domain-containing protein [Sphaerochaetaceae bacterium]|nr:DUF4325 domain-containing protein [Sphaerochaetaceae bacterium]